MWGKPVPLGPEFRHARPNDGNASTIREAKSSHIWAHLWQAWEASPELKAPSRVACCDLGCCANSNICVLPLSFQANEPNEKKNKTGRETNRADVHKPHGAGTLVAVQS